MLLLLTAKLFAYLPFQTPLNARAIFIGTVWTKIMVFVQILMGFGPTNKANPTSQTEITRGRGSQIQASWIHSKIIVTNSLLS